MMKIIYLGDGCDYSENSIYKPPLTIGKEYDIEIEFDGEYLIKEADDGSYGWTIQKEEFKKVRNFKNLFGLLNHLYKI